MLNRSKCWLLAVGALLLAVDVCRASAAKCTAMPPQQISSALHTVRKALPGLHDPVLLEFEEAQLWVETFADALAFFL